jgi:hypothetical protein
VADAAWLTEETAILVAGRLVQRGPLAELMRAPADPSVANLLDDDALPTGEVRP